MTTKALKAVKTAALAAIAAAAFALAAPQPARAEGFDADLFNIWTQARAGTGAPVYWYSVGTVRAYPSGELLFTMEGYDTARSERPDPNQPLVRQFSRKTYIYRDARTGEILREYNGQRVDPIAYPYQYITYELKGDKVETFVEQGAGPALRRMGPGSGMSARRLGDSAVFTAPVYLDFPIAGTQSRYQAFENYDFFIQPEGSVREPHQLSWVRYGSAPRWAGGQPVIMHLVTWRVERFEDVPEGFRRYIETEAPLWRAPPTGLDDIRRLQSEQSNARGF